MKKNLHNQSNNHNYFQNNLVLSTASLIGNNNNPSNSGLYQQNNFNNNNNNNNNSYNNQQHILANQQFFYPTILTNKNSNRNTSQRLSFNSNHFEKIHYNNNNMGAGGSNFQISIPQHFNNNNNYHYSAHPQMIYSNERRHSYNSMSQQQQHQQQQQQQQTVLTNLSNNQNYSKRNNSNNSYKPSFQKQMSLPEQTINEITEQIKSVSLSSPTQSPNLNQQTQISNTDSDSEKQTTHSASTTTNKSSTFNYLSPVYENNLEIKDDDQHHVNEEDVFYEDDDDNDDVIHVIEENEISEEINVNSSSSSELSSSTTTTTTNLISNQAVKISEIEQQIENYKDKNEYLRYLISRYPDSKWPLHSTWTFWFIKHDSNKTWSDNLKTIIDISYVEDFWSTTTYLLNIPNLINQGDLTFFKKGIKPEWEDEQNKSGGCWLYQMNNQQSSQQQFNKKMDDLFMETLLALIGDNYCDSDLINKLDKSYFEKKNTPNNDHICDFLSGTILMHRGKNEKLALWTKNYKDDVTTRLIGKIWKNIMKLNENVTINFEAHETKNSKVASSRVSYKE